MNVFKEAQKAETHLKLIERQRANSHELVEIRYDRKKSTFIEALPVQVRAALRGAAVIEPLDNSELGESDHSPALLAKAGFFAQPENRAKFGIPESDETPVES